METKRKELYERLNKTKDHEEYIPVIKTVKDTYMIIGDKVARASRESRRRYESYLENKSSERLEKLIMSVELDSEKRKGIWFDLKGFTDKLGEEDIKLIELSIEKYSK